MTPKELTEEIRIVQLAAYVSLGISLINIFVIMFFSYCLLNGVAK